MDVFVYVVDDFVRVYINMYKMYMCVQWYTKIYFINIYLLHIKYI